MKKQRAIKNRETVYTNVPKYRTFEGKKYEHYQGRNTKREAQKVRKQTTKHGYNARIVKGTNWSGHVRYRVYRRLK